MKKNYTIVAGVGIDRCVVGARKEDAIILFGSPSSEGNVHTTFQKSGISIACDGDHRIVRLFVYYQSPDLSSFSGSTSDGIGAQSSVDDVLRVYGVPSRVGESVVSRFGPKPGANEKRLEYDKAGISFTFWDGTLASIWITKPDS